MLLRLPILYLATKTRYNRLGYSLKKKKRLVIMILFVVNNNCFTKVVLLPITKHKLVYFYLLCILMIFLQMTF